MVQIHPGREKASTYTAAHGVLSMCQPNIDCDKGEISNLISAVEILDLKQMSGEVLRNITYYPRKTSSATFPELYLTIHNTHIYSLLRRCQHECPYIM